MMVKEIVDTEVGLSLRLCTQPVTHPDGLVRPHPQNLKDLLAQKLTRFEANITIERAGYLVAVSE